MVDINMLVYPEIIAEIEMVTGHVKNGTKPDDYLDGWKRALVEAWKLLDKPTGEESDAILFSELMLLANAYSKLISKDEAKEKTVEWLREYKGG